jgi:acyl CoA:acetate/3-ketoacid CoA transferase alpha subunit
MILSYVGTNKVLQDAYFAGEIAMELSPQGTIAERLRAAGAGMPGIFTRTGAGRSAHLCITSRAHIRDVHRDGRYTAKAIEKR